MSVDKGPSMNRRSSSSRKKENIFRKSSMIRRSFKEIPRVFHGKEDLLKALFWIEDPQQIENIQNVLCGWKATRRRVQILYECKIFQRYFLLGKPPGVFNGQEVFKGSSTEKVTFKTTSRDRKASEVFNKLEIIKVSFMGTMTFKQVSKWFRKVFH